MIEYERLNVPGHPGAPVFTMVDAQIRFRFYGAHTHGAAVAEAESRLALVAGCDITDMSAQHLLAAPMPEDFRIVDTHTPGLSATAAEYASRVACALDLIDNPSPGADPADMLDLVRRVLTRTAR
jgi:hypothetical protein